MDERYAMSSTKRRWLSKLWHPCVAEHKRKSLLQVNSCRLRHTFRLSSCSSVAGSALRARVECGDRALGAGDRECGLVHASASRARDQRTQRVLACDHVMEVGVEDLRLDQGEE